VTADDELDLAAVGAFLRDSGVEVSDHLESRLIAGGRSNLTYHLTDGHRAFVLRHPPTRGRTPSAHDVAREFTVTKALGQTAVPVAAVVASCEDEALIGAPFTVVEFVPGCAVRTRSDLERLTDDEINGCVQGLLRAFAELHSVDHVAIGLEGYGRPDAYAARQLRRWSGQWDLVASRPRDMATRLRDQLLGSIPEQRSTSIVHGDYRIDNVLLDPTDPTRVAAIVDWELSTIGDPVADVAMMCAYRHPALDLILGTPAAWTSDRLPSALALASAYESLGTIELHHWEFYMGLAYYKLAVIAEGINHRFLVGATVGDGFDTAGESVDALLEAGLAQVGLR
jgi:aminoglycoside phosphotransferase (APT) family kinase protein